MIPDEVRAMRLATQRLTGPAASDPAEAVRCLLAMQAQDAPLARLAVAQRADCHVDAVRDAIDAGRILRSHVLRPTWHLVAAEDLPWLLELTSPKVMSGQVGRHRQLGLDAATVSSAFDSIIGRLGDTSERAPGHATRTELADRLLRDSVLQRGPLFGQQVGHLLMLAELNAVIASGPMARHEHTYALLDAPRPGRPRDEALAELVFRFFASHGPVSIPDLQRWVPLTIVDIRLAIEAAGPALASVIAEDVELWYAPDAVLPTTRPSRAWLLSTFDEAFLTYRDLPWPRWDGHPLADKPYRWAEVGGGPVLCDLADGGSWRRTTRSGRLRISLDLADGLSRGRAREAERAARRVADALTRAGERVELDHAART